MASKLDAFKAEFLTKLAILDAKLEASNGEFLTKLALLDAKYEAKFIALYERVGRLEAKVNWGFGLMFAFHVVEIALLTKLGFT